MSSATLPHNIYTGAAHLCMLPPAAACLPPGRPQNPFGAAKPREAVIAEKLGKTEEEVLKEEVSKEKLHVRTQMLQLQLNSN